MVAITIGEPAKSVAIYLGISLRRGVLHPAHSRRDQGPRVHQSNFLPRIGPITLVALLFTIVVMFSLKVSLWLQPRLFPNTRVEVVSPSL